MLVRCGSEIARARQGSFRLIITVVPLYKCHFPEIVVDGVAPSTGKFVIQAAAVIKDLFAYSRRIAEVAHSLANGVEGFTVFQFLPIFQVDAEAQRIRQSTLVVASNGAITSVIIKAR